MNHSSDEMSGNATFRTVALAVSLFAAVFIVLYKTFVANFTSTSS